MSTPRPHSDPSSTAPNDRPPIWVNGRQRPSFDLRAYGAYSVIATRAALGPALVRVSGSATGLQAKILAGAFAIKTQRLGRAAAYLPTRPGIAATIGSLATLLQETASVVSPSPPPPESLEAYDALWRSRKPPASGRLRGVSLDEVRFDPDLSALRADLPLRPQRPVRPIVVVKEMTEPTPVVPEPPDAPVVLTLAPVATAPLVPAPAPAPEEATLLAIRDLILDADAIVPTTTPAPAAAATVATAAAGAAPTAPIAPPRIKPRKPLPAWTKPVFRHLRQGTAFGLAWVLIVAAMPIGLVKAGIAHLDGRDLRDLVLDE